MPPPGHMGICRCAPLRARALLALAAALVGKCDAVRVIRRPCDEAALVEWVREPAGICR